MGVRRPVVVALVVGAALFQLFSATRRLDHFSPTPTHALDKVEPPTHALDKVEPLHTLPPLASAGIGPDKVEPLHTLPPLASASIGPEKMEPLHTLPPLASASIGGPRQRAMPCADGCEANGGNCNQLLGRCDCPPMRAGEACERNAAPMCAEQWGLALPAPPCQALVDQSSDWRDFPATCE